MRADEDTLCNHNLSRRSCLGGRLFEYTNLLRCKMMYFWWLVNGTCRKDKGGALSNHQAWGHLDGDTHPNWRTDIDDNPGPGFVVFTDGCRDL